MRSRKSARRYRRRRGRAWLYNVRFLPLAELEWLVWPW